MNPPRCTTMRRLNALTIAKMMRAMLDAPHSTHDLAEVSGLSLSTARHYVLTLHREGACHIAQWATDTRGRHTTPEYMIGRRKDAVMPKKSRVESNRAYRARQQQKQALFALAGQALEAA